VSDKFILISFRGCSYEINAHSIDSDVDGHVTAVMVDLDVEHTKLGNEADDTTWEGKAQVCFSSFFLY
jgi:hypothetical protein